MLFIIKTVRANPCRLNLQPMKNLMLILCLFCLPELASAQLQIPETPFMLFRFSSDQCQGLVHAGGSRIYVPEGAFMYKKDKSAYSGIVILKYREYHDRWDFVSNELSLNSPHGFLESAGMFEVRAETPEEEELELRDGKKIQVRFADPKPIDNVASWFWDEQKKQWLKQSFKPSDVSNKQADESDKWGKAPAPDLDVEEAEWMDGWGDDFPEYSKHETEVFKAMDIDKMGLHNYDILLDQAEAVPVLANFEISNAADSSFSKIYVVYEESNSVVYYYLNKKSQAENFRLLNEPYKIFCIFRDGSVAKLPDPGRINGNELLAVKGKAHTFKLVHEPRIPKTKKQLILATR